MSESESEILNENNKRPSTSRNTHNGPKRYTFDRDQLISQNKYYIPSQAEKEYLEKTENTQNDKKQIIPPIFLREANNYQEIIKDLQEHCEHLYTTTYRNNSIKITLTNSSDYRKMTKYYDQQNIQYFTFPDAQNPKLQVIIRGIPTSLTIEEIKQDLLALEYPVIKVVRLLKKDKSPMPLCAVELENSEQAKDIFNLSRLHYCIVTVEQRRNSRDIPQCTNCQRYGHTKNYCRLTPRCVKCTVNHHFSQCPKLKEEKPKCVNCEGEHTANYKGCIYFKKTCEKTGHIHRSAINYSRPENVNRRTNSNISYADAAAGRSQHVNNNTQNVTSHTQQQQQFSFNPILHAIVEIIKPHLETIKNFFLNLMSTLIQN